MTTAEHLIRHAIAYALARMERNPSPWVKKHLMELVEELKLMRVK